jgi:serine/threonine protein kinase
MTILLHTRGAALHGVLPMETFGPYLVYEQLGAGGSGIVHRARLSAQGQERDLALKRLLAAGFRERTSSSAVMRDLELATFLLHPNIAQTFQVVRDSEIPYLVREHVDGIDLRKILRYARRSGEIIPLGVVLSLLVELCDALDYAHTFVEANGDPHEICHRDLSPSNLIVANTGDLKVIDFGVARATSRPNPVQQGCIIGKLGYVAPETTFGHHEGPVSDVFSIGVIAYELLTRRPLFSAQTEVETVQRVRAAEAPPPSWGNPACSSTLDAVVAAALRRESYQRTPSAAELRASLEDVAARAGITPSRREVFDWLVGDSSVAWPGAPRSRNTSRQRAAADLARLRPLPLPPPPPEPSLGRARAGSSGRMTSLAHAAALAESGQARGLGGELTSLPSSAEDELMADLAWADAPASWAHRPYCDEATGSANHIAVRDAQRTRSVSKRAALSVVALAIAAVVLAGVFLMRQASAPSSSAATPPTAHSITPPTPPSSAAPP